VSIEEFWAIPANQQLKALGMKGLHEERHQFLPTLEGKADPGVARPRTLLVSVGGQ
jgi:hypothetical protein